MHPPELITFLKQFKEIKAEQLDEIAGVIPVKNYNKGAVLVHEGKVPPACYFVLKGCVRQFTIKDGIERTTAIYTEKNGAISSTNFVEESPSPFTLVCLEDCLLIEGSRDIDASNMEAYPVFGAIISKIMENDLNKAKEQMAFFITSTPEERYLNFLENHSDISMRIPQHYIASLLGITPESLSRIRKRLAKKPV